ncbi:MAG: ABC transporter ATP-binding protein [Pirellulales bacterium]|nr:ABC transporter ATP-binding protein [Pirellulales bacterium]
MLDVSHLSKRYPAPGGDLHVVQDVSFQMTPGETLAIMGPSGSGKSTLLAMLGGLEIPSEGTVRLDGIDPYAGGSAERAAYRNREVGFVFQEHQLLPGCTALDNVVLPALATGRVTAAQEQRGRDLLGRVGLAERAGHLPGELSGGERQRVAVARAMLLEPRLLLADEPTGQLDSQTADGVTDLLVEMAREAGGMLVVVTHADSIAARIGPVRRLVDGMLA